MISRLGAAPNRSLPTPSVWVDSNPHALVTNPNAFGGEQVDFTAFVRVLLTKGWYAKASCAQPISLDLNGPQASDKDLFSLEIGTSF